jgi:hypothetical protein
MSGRSRETGWCGFTNAPERISQELGTPGGDAAGTSQNRCQNQGTTPVFRGPSPFNQMRVSLQLDRPAQLPVGVVQTGSMDETDLAFPIADSSLVPVHLRGRQAGWHRAAPSNQRIRPTCVRGGAPPNNGPEPSAVGSLVSLLRTRGAALGQDAVVLPGHLTDAILTSVDDNGLPTDECGIIACQE